MLKTSLLAAFFLILAAPVFAQDICRRQNLTGDWVNPAPGEGDMWKIEIRYDCSRNLFSMRSVPYNPGFASGWSTRSFASLVGPQDGDHPVKIGASWEPARPCVNPPNARENIKFWNVITKFTTAGLEVLYRGRMCERNAPFVRRYVFRRDV